MFDEGTDHSPVELDGLGGNAGISTPYLPFGGNPPQQYPEYQQLGDESVMRINGQDVRATLDGVGIPFAFALHLLQNGSALPAALDRYQHLQGFRFESNGLGTFSVNIPRQVGWNVTYNGANDDRGTASAVYLGSNNYTFSFGAVGLQDQSRPPWNVPNRKLDDKEVSTLRNQVETILRNEDCAKFIEKLLEIANELFPAQLFNPAKGLFNHDILNTFDRVAEKGGFLLAPTASFSSLSGNLIDEASSSRLPTVYLAYYDPKSVNTKYPEGNSKKAIAWRTQQNKMKQRIFANTLFTSGASTTIHELLHFSFNDIELASAVASITKDVNFVRPKSEFEGSKYWNTELEKHCGIK
jgi:hypothetical protein